MKTLKFGDPESIAYAKAKGLEGLNLRTWESHSCNCEFCEEEKEECPYCGSHEEPEEEVNNLVKCSECGEKAWPDYWAERDNKEVISKFEKNEENI